MRPPLPPHGFKRQLAMIYCPGGPSPLHFKLPAGDQPQGTQRLSELLGHPTNLL